MSDSPRDLTFERLDSPRVRFLDPSLRGSSIPSPPGLIDPQGRVLVGPGPDYTLGWASGQCRGSWYPVNPPVHG